MVQSCRERPRQDIHDVLDEEDDLQYNQCGIILIINEV